MNSTLTCFGNKQNKINDGHEIIQKPLHIFYIVEF